VICLSHRINCVFRMADNTSSYSIEERLMANVWMHERQHTGQTMFQVMAAFRERFNKAPPRRATLLGWEKRAFALGSVKDRPRSGRKTARLETCAAVAAAIEHSPMKSTRKRSSELGVPRATVRDHMKKGLNVRPYRPTFVNELWDGDMDRRYESCRALLDTFSNAVTRSKVLFSEIVPSIAVRATEVWCSDQRRIPISRRNWNIIHLMLRYGRL